MQTSIARVEKNGELVLLINGTKWAISSFDAFYTRMWLVGDKIETSMSSLTNVSRQNKKVSARQV